MSHACYLEELGFKNKVLDFFEPYFVINSSDCVGFEYYVNLKLQATEYCSKEGTRIPSTSGIWITGSDSPPLVRNLYLFSSALEALSFFHFFTDKLRYPEQIAIISLGILPSLAQVNQLKTVYRNAKIHFVFEAALLGRVFDCRLFLWIKNKDGKFSFIKERNAISIDFRCKTYQISVSQLSLFAFEKRLGLRSGIRTHKPPVNFNSFYELLLSSI